MASIDWPILPTKEQVSAIYERYGGNLSAFFEDAHRAARERAERLRKNPNYEAEHERLCSTLVEADKAERLLTFECLPLIDDLNNHDKHKARFDAWDQAQQARLDAVDALLKFEASHAIGQKDREK